MLIHSQINYKTNAFILFELYASLKLLIWKLDEIVPKQLRKRYINLLKTRFQLASCSSHSTVSINFLIMLINKTDICIANPFYCNMNSCRKCSFNSISVPRSESTLEHHRVFCIGSAPPTLHSHHAKRQFNGQVFTGVPQNREHVQVILGKTAKTTGSSTS